MRWRVRSSSYGVVRPGQPTWAISLRSCQRHGVDRSLRRYDNARRTWLVLNDEEFAEFVQTRGPALLRTACFLSGSPQEGEDLLQQTLVNAYASFRRIREPAALEGYVRTTMVLRVCATMGRGPSGATWGSSPGTGPLLRSLLSARTSGTPKPASSWRRSPTGTFFRPLGLTTWRARAVLSRHPMPRRPLD